MKLRTTLAATGLALVAFGAQAQNLVTNGSFEANVIRAGGWGTYTSLVGWTGQPNIELRNNVAGIAQQGSNYVELDTNRNSSMFQDILGTGLVNLSFFYAARPNTGITNGLGFSFGSFGVSTLLAGVANATSTHNWMQYTLNNFQLNASGITRLSFFATGRSDGYGGSLDNVSVSAVPEVETYAMLLAGLGLLGVASRRRRNKALTA
jgi:MYXO-CTERM domain-containing protein